MAGIPSQARLVRHTLSTLNLEAGPASADSAAQRSSKPTRGEAADTSKPSVALGSICCGGAVCGVDMTPESLAGDRRHRKYSHATAWDLTLHQTRRVAPTSERQVRVAPGESPHTFRVHTALAAAAPSRPRRGR